MGIEPSQTVRTSVIVGSDQYKRIAAIAEANNVSVAWVIRTAIGQFLEQHEDQMRLPLQIPRFATGD
jgi:predicted transcriptional regulator